MNFSSLCFWFLRRTVSQRKRSESVASPAPADFNRPDPVVLRKKAQKKREETKDDRWKAPIEKSTKSFSQALGNALLRPFEILLFEPMALILDIYSAILLGILYLFFGAFAVVYEGVYGFELWQVGLTFLGLLVGLFAGAMSSGLWQGVRARLIARNGGKIEPEFRLPSVIVGAAFVTVGLFWFAWTTLRWVHWIVPVIGSAIFGCGVSTFPLPKSPWHSKYLCHIATINQAPRGPGAPLYDGGTGTAQVENGYHTQHNARVLEQWIRQGPSVGLSVSFLTHRFLCVASRLDLSYLSALL